MTSDRNATYDNWQSTVLDLDDTQFPPVFTLTDPPEDRFRNTPSNTIPEYLDAKILDSESRSSAIAEFERRGVSPTWS